MKITKILKYENHETFQINIYIAIKVSRNLRIVSPGITKSIAGRELGPPQNHPYTYMIYRAFRQLSY